MNATQIRESFVKNWENAYKLFNLESKEPRLRYTPDVRFFNTSTTAGKASKMGNYVAYNTEIARVAGSAFENTIIHEIAHIVTFRLYPSAKPHGKEWKSIFVKLGGNGRRCYSYDITGSSVVKNRTKAKCSCKTHLITTQKVNKMKKGVTYTCKLCKTKLSLVSV